MVIFGAEMEVAQKDCCFGAGDHQDPKYQKQETEHVIHLAGPQRIQNEEQLDENAPKW